MAKPLDLKDRKIMQLIGQSPSATILGLLPVEPSDQDGILELVKTLANGSFNRLAQLQEEYPAATGYAIALALSKGTTEANFYNALENQLGVKIGMNRRQELSMAFDVACRALGLEMPDSEEDANADRNLRPIIFQAGILHYWVEPLAAAVLSYLERNPCPDLEDEQQIVPFARLLAARVPAAQARLRRTLESSVGPLVCRAILSAFSSRDFDQLPPHLREPMQEARRQTGGESIRSPYLRYNPEDASMEVVLPKQSSKLADFRSCWVLGTNTYNGLIERTLAVEELPGTKCQILLTGLRNQFQDQVFTVKLAPDEQEPFFIFRATDGRRVQVGLRPVIELPLGDYHLVLPVEHKTNEEESFSLRGKFKVGKVEVFPGRDDLAIVIGKSKTLLRPRLGSDILIQDKNGKKLQSLDGTTLFYGEELEMQAFTPAGPSGDSEAMEFKIECLENPAVAPKKLLREKANTRGAYVFYDLSADLVRPFLNGLPAGIHEVQVTAEGRARNFSRRFFYWKGFRRTTKSFGFICDEVPHNFDPATSVGARKAERGLEICDDHHAAEVVIGIKHPQKTFTLAKPGIWLRLTDPERRDSRPIALGKSIEVNSNEQLIVESGDTTPWNICCDNTIVAELKPGQARHTLNLGALLSQFGESLALEAKNASGHTQQLVSFAKANLSRNLTIEATPGTQRYKATFRIGRSQIQDLELEIQNFAEFDGVARAHKFAIAEGEFDVPSFGADAAKLLFALEENDWVAQLAVDLTKLAPGVYFVDFRSRKAGQTRWQPLRVADKHGLSESRLVILTEPLCGDGGKAWGHLLATASQTPDVDDTAEETPVPDKEVPSVLEKVQRALLFKYASAVWPGIRWLEAALVRFCQERYSGLRDPICKAFAEIAVSTLSQKSESSLSIHTTLVFGSQELLLAQQGGTFAKVGSPKTQIGRSFRELGELANSPSLKAHAFRPNSIDLQFFGYFANAPAVSNGHAKEFQEFKTQEYFKDLAEQSQELDFKQGDISAGSLLTAEHFLAGVRALNRRFRPLEQARNNNETDAALARLNSEIQACGNRLDQVSPTVKGLVGFPNYVDLSIPISIAESVLVQVVSDLILTVTGLARLAANGLLSREIYFESLNFLLSPEGTSLSRRTHRLSLLLSLAPELFAFYMLFWEATLKPRAQT
ncbi:MAG: hypothetical protein JW395_3929 [Nitrospira sp.]|nr:hypothetical protein [Nitrospira sp.]